MFGVSRNVEQRRLALEKAPADLNVEKRKIVVCLAFLTSQLPRLVALLL